jgi:hypothetical protein
MSTILPETHKTYRTAFVTELLGERSLQRLYNLELVAASLNK